MNTNRAIELIREHAESNAVPAHLYEHAAELIVSQYQNATLREAKKDAYIDKQAATIERLTAALKETSRRYDILEGIYANATGRKYDGENGTLARNAALLAELDAS